MMTLIFIIRLNKLCFHGCEISFMFIHRAVPARLSIWAGMSRTHIYVNQIAQELLVSAEVIPQLLFTYAFVIFGYRDKFVFSLLSFDNKNIF